MIELNNKTKHDFLSREWVQRLLDAGVDMSDAKYCIVEDPGFKKDMVCTINAYEFFIMRPESKKSREEINIAYKFCLTYTVSELLYKLHEWEDKNIEDKKCRGDICFMLDAPYYMVFFHLVGDETVEIYNDMCGMSEYPIESLAMLLIQCHQKDVGIKVKDTGNIQEKYERY